MVEKPSVFISYNHSSRALVTEIVKKLDGIAYVHWDQNVGPWESFSQFMSTIRKQDYAVLIISDSYLRTEACLYEVTQLMSVSNWDKKTLFVVEDNARKIYKSSHWIEYIEYWDCKINEYEKKTAKYSDVEALKGELEKLTLIKKQIGTFLQKIADVNNPEVWQAIDAIVERLRISGKNNSAEDLEKMIIDLIKSGQNTTEALMIATNRSRSSIVRYLSKLRKSGAIAISGKVAKQKVYILI